MAEEYLEFAAEDFGRLAAHLGELERILKWMESQGFAAPRVRNAVIKAYEEAKDLQPRPGSPAAGFAFKGAGKPV